MRDHVGLLVVATLAAALAGACAGDSERRVDRPATDARAHPAAPIANPGSTIVFETGVPGVVDGCDGLWAVDRTGGGVRLFAGTGVNGEEPAIPSFATDGKTLVFGLAGDGYDFHLHALALETGRVRPLASRTGALFLRAWSPARNELLTTRRANSRRGYELVVLRTAGRERVLGPRPRTIDYAWSPDGIRLAFSEERRDRTGFLWVREAAGGEARAIARLPSGGAGEAFPAWSPDGRAIAFFRGTDLWVVGADGRDPRLLTRGPGREPVRPVLWLPPGRKLLLTRDRDPAGPDPWSYDVLLVDVETGKVEPYLEAVVLAGISPAGDELLFLRPHRNVTIPGGFFAPENMYSVRVAPLAGGGERTVAVMHESVLRHGSLPVWQPRAEPLRSARGALAPKRVDFCARRLEAFRSRLAR